MAASETTAGGTPTKTPTKNYQSAFLKIYWMPIFIIDRVTFDEKLIEMIEG
jgi:hypothetical protein